MKETYAFIIKSMLASMCFLSRKVDDKYFSRTEIERQPREKERRRVHNFYDIYTFSLVYTPLMENLYESALISIC